MLGFGKKKETTKKDQAQEDYLRGLRSAVDRIVDSPEHKKRRQEMNRYLKQFRGEWWDEKVLKNTDSRVYMNFAFSTVMSIAPLLTDNRPISTIRARQPFMQKVFDLYSLVLEYLWDKVEMDTKIFKWVLNALVMKIGVLQVWFDPDAELGGEISITPIDPRTYFCAPGYDDNWDAPFQGTVTRRPLSYIRTLYPETGKDVKPDEADESTDYAGRKDYQLHSDDVTVYAVWMRDAATEEFLLEGKDGQEPKKSQRPKYPYGKFVTFTKDLILLDEKPSPYKHNRPPFVTLVDYFDPGELYGISESQIIENLNKSYNRALQLFDQWVNQFCNPNWLIDSRSLGVNIDKVREDLQGGGNAWQFNSVSADQTPIKKVDVGNLPGEVIQLVMTLPKLIEEETGQTDISKGVPSKTQRQSAMEVSTLIEASYTRTRQRVRNLEAALKRVNYLIVNLMQQFYTEIRDFSVQRDKTAEWYQVSNRPDFLKNLYGQPPQGIQLGSPPQGGENPEEQQEYDDFEKFLKNFGEVDSVYADFDLTIDTNSTLPMDKQSLANLFLRLAAMKIVDPEAVIKQLRIPQGDEIIGRMQQAAAAMAQAKTGTPQLPGPPGQPAQDITDLLGGAHAPA